MQTLTEFEKSYIETALWASCDSSDVSVPLDNSKYADVEFAPAAIERIHADCAKFEPLAIAILNAQDYCSGDFPLAHDFWLTRNRHGAGFWDGDYPEPLATQLTDLAHSFGECDIYIGDDGQFHIA